MPAVSIGYGRNRMSWDEDDPSLAAQVIAEMAVRLNQDAHTPLTVTACALAADTVCGLVEALHLDRTDTVVWRRNLVRDLVRRLQGTARLVYPEDGGSPAHTRRPGSTPAAPPGGGGTGEDTSSMGREP